VINELFRIAERVRQNRAAQRAAIDAERTTTPSTGARRVAPHLPGDRVFDPITGLEGVIVHGTRENVIVPTPKR
jgi:hypothetical protein